MKNMTKKEIIEKLDEAGIEYNPEANKAELEKLLNPEEDVEEQTEEETKVEEEPTIEEKPKEETKIKAEVAYKSQLQKTKEKLAKQPRVRIMIPKEKSESEGASETVQINGYTYQIKKGVYVEVPEQVAKIIMESQQQTEEAFVKASKVLADDERPEFDNSQV